MKNVEKVGQGRAQESKTKALGPKLEQYTQITWVGQ